MIDLCAGRGGWTKGFLAEDWKAIGFDIQQHGYPAQLVLQDVRTVDGGRLWRASAFVASAPCQDFTRHQLPWLARKNPPPPDLSIIEACRRIHAEAEAAAGHKIPFVMENVRNAQRWIGPAAWHYGSRYLWGDVPAIMPFAEKSRKEHLSSSAVALRAEIPFELARYIARVFKPVVLEN